MEFQLIYFKSLKMMLWKCCTQYASKFGKLFQQWSQDWKRSVFIPIPKKGNAKECPDYHTITFISHANKVILKILQARLSSKWTENFQVYKLDLEKADEPEIKFLASVSEKSKEPRKTSIFTSFTMLKPLIVWITSCEKFLKRWEYQTTLTVSWETCRQDKKQQLELNMKQWIGSKLGKNYDKSIYCHPAYLTSMQITSLEMLGCMIHKLESRLPGEITSNTQMIPP